VGVLPGGSTSGRTYYSPPLLNGNRGESAWLCVGHAAQKLALMMIFRRGKTRLFVGAKKCQTKTEIRHARQPQKLSARDNSLGGLYFIVSARLLAQANYANLQSQLSIHNLPNQHCRQQCFGALCRWKTRRFRSDVHYRDLLYQSASDPCHNSIARRVKIVMDRRA
jgi:hypothetical protein